MSARAADAENMCMLWYGHRMSGTLSQTPVIRGDFLPGPRQSSTGAWSQHIHLSHEAALAELDAFLKMEHLFQTWFRTIGARPSRYLLVIMDCFLSKFTFYVGGRS